MIIKNVTLGKTKNVTICELGFKDVLLQPSDKNEDGQVAFGLRTVNEMEKENFKRNPIQDFDGMQPEIVFIFNNIECIDCLLSHLNICKSNMLNEFEQKEKENPIYCDCKNPEIVNDLADGKPYCNKCGFDIKPKD